MANNSQFVTSALQRLARYAGAGNDNFLREYVKLGAMLVERHAAEVGTDPPGNLDDLRAMAADWQEEQDR